MLEFKQVDLIRRYIEEGGFIFAEACCGDEAFSKGFRQLMARVLKDKSKLEPIDANHPIWSSHLKLEPKEFGAGSDPDRRIQAAKLGDRTVVVFSPQPLAGYWEEARFMPRANQVPTSRGELAYAFAGNVIAFATKLKMPKPRLTEISTNNKK
jgi:hypothetical protein